jgi:hypothetical protein
VEPFNGRIEDVLQSHHFQSGEKLEAARHRYVWLYNRQLPQSALGSKTPLQVMKDWHNLKPDLFKKQPYHRPGCDTYEQIYTRLLLSRKPRVRDITACRTAPHYTGRGHVRFTAMSFG